MVPMESATINRCADIRRPTLRRTLAEPIALIRPAPAIALDELVAQAPSGDRRAVLVLPPLGRGDAVTATVRTFLARVGYRAYGWGLGVNVGPTQRLLEGSAALLAQLCASHGPVSLLGFSLGGLFARWLALHSPGSVREVITVCSPINDPAAAFWLPLAPFLGLWPGYDLRILAEEVRQPLPMSRTILFSRDDGIVNWRSCVDASCPGDCFEISGPHTLIARNPQVMRIVAARLGESRRPGAPSRAK